MEWEELRRHSHVVQARFRLIVTIRPKCAFKQPATIVQAPAPEHIVEAGLPTEALLAQVAVSKYSDGLPLYRQEAIYARNGVELGRSLMAQWMGAVGFPHPTGSLCTLRPRRYRTHPQHSLSGGSLRPTRAGPSPAGPC